MAEGPTASRASFSSQRAPRSAPHQRRSPAPPAASRSSVCIELLRLH
uniref:Uncharacterized protein n=1 Tax=Arundo donax TaxID=35708 RepID=A0A0A9E189_ARUDO